MRPLAGHASVQTAKRADGLNRIVGAKRQANPVLQHGVPRVGTFDPLTADAVLGPAHVRGLVRRLHRSNHFEFREALEIHRRDHLRVLDAVAAVARAIRLANGFENVESNAVGAISDGMKVQLKAGLIALDGHGAQFVGIVSEDSRR